MIVSVGQFYRQFGENVVRCSVDGMCGVIRVATRAVHVRLLSRRGSYICRRKERCRRTVVSHLGWWGRGQ